MPAYVNIRIRTLCALRSGLVAQQLPNLPCNGQGSLLAEPSPYNLHGDRSSMVSLWIIWEPIVSESMTSISRQVCGRG